MRALERLSEPRFFGPIFKIDRFAARGDRSPMIQPVLGILVVRHLDGSRVSTREGFDWDPSQQSVPGVGLFDTIFMCRITRPLAQTQRDEIRGEFETYPIFSKLIDFVRRALLGAFWSSSILASAWFEAVKRCQIARFLAQKGVDRPGGLSSIWGRKSQQKPPDAF